MRRAAEERVAAGEDVDRTLDTLPGGGSAAFPSANEPLPAVGTTASALYSLDENLDDGDDDDDYGTGAGAGAPRSTLQQLQRVDLAQQTQQTRGEGAPQPRVNAFSGEAVLGVGESAEAAADREGRWTRIRELSERYRSTVGAGVGATAAGALEDGGGLPGGVSAGGDIEEAKDSDLAAAGGGASARGVAEALPAPPEAAAPAAAALSAAAVGASAGLGGGSAAAATDVDALE